MATPRSHQITIDFDVPAKMRDGTILRANVYRPATEGKWPVLLTRLPYGKDLSLLHTLFDAAQAARQGYVVIIQDTRGRSTSDGDWEPMRREALDGYDTVEWASRLHYSSGQVGMFGLSYFGFTQWVTILEQQPNLKAAVPMMAWGDPLNGVTFRNGAFELGTAAQWNLMMGIDVLTRRYRGERDPRKLRAVLYQLVKDFDAIGPQGYYSLPLKDFAPLKRNDVSPSFFELIKHPMDRVHSDPMTILGKYERAGVPTFNIGGWYDIYLQDTITNFNHMREHGATAEARQSKLLIGPWTHANFSNPIGELNFGLAATAALLDYRTDLFSLQIRWFDQWLKGINTGILDEAPVKIFVMGANVWRDEQAWPLERAVETRYYLHSNGHANTLHGDGTLSTAAAEVEEPDQYSYDPANPVPTRGGATRMADEFRPGPYDQRTIESRDDVLVYSTAPLERAVEVTGPIKVHLWAISSAPDTDFVARLVDVHPDGYAQNLTDGIIRARYRNFEHGEQPSLIESGRAYEYEIDLWSTSNLFKQGHRIRLDITSSSFPRWDRNPNTGHDFGADSELVVAKQTILHDAEHPSYVLLPIIHDV